ARPELEDNGVARAREIVSQITASNARLDQGAQNVPSVSRRLVVRDRSKGRRAENQLPLGDGEKLPLHVNGESIRGHASNAWGSGCQVQNQGEDRETIHAWPPICVIHEPWNLPTLSDGSLEADAHRFAEPDKKFLMAMPGGVGYVGPAVGAAVCRR